MVKEVRAYFKCFPLTSTSFVSVHVVVKGKWCMHLFQSTCILSCLVKVWLSLIYGTFQIGGHGFL